MLFFLVLCAIVAVFLIVLSCCSDLRDLWTHPEHHDFAGGSPPAGHLNPHNSHRL